MPVNSSYPTFKVPVVDIWTFLFERKDKPFSDNKVLYIDPDNDRTYTFVKLKSAALAFGRGLRGLWDWRKGDVLALFAPNNIDTPVVMWGALWAGGILSPANPTYTVHELAFQLKESGAKGICTVKELLPTALKAAHMVRIETDRIILIGENHIQHDKAVKHFTTVKDHAAGASSHKVKFRPDDLAFLVSSSGTTGLPKLVMLTHQNIISNVMQLRSAEQELTSSDIVIAFLPFFHIYGLSCLLHQACDKGFELIIMPKFEIERFCQIIQHYKATFSYVVPPVLLLLSKHPIVAKYNLSSIRMFNSGAAPLTKDLIDAVNKRITLPVKQGYGLSETSPTTHTQPWKDWNKTIGSVGKLLANMTAKYIDEFGQEIPVGQIGELALKGPNVFKGYLHKPELTKQSFSEDGFFLTGDIGYQDGEGNFYITDRVKELIKYKGFQVAPAELEGILVGHPKVDDVAVIGVYSAADASELPRAYVKLATAVNPSKETEADIKTYLASKVAPYKKLRGGIRFVQEIPKSASGKILRRIIKHEANTETKSKL